MKFYYFSGANHIEKGRIKQLEQNGFTGVLFTYDPSAGDYLTRIAEDCKNTQNIRYMVAMRPQAMSAQYLCMVGWGMNQIATNRLEFNLISGHIKEKERNIGGILGDVTDYSSHIERSNYLISYLNELAKMDKEKSYHYIPDFFVSTTNQYVFDVCKKHGYKMIIPYREYKQGYWTKYDNYGGWSNTPPSPDYTQPIDIADQIVMIVVAPLLKKTEEELQQIDRTMLSNDSDLFTYDSFKKFVTQLKNEGVKYLMITPIDELTREWELDSVIEYIGELNKEGI